MLSRSQDACLDETCDEYLDLIFLEDASSLDSLGCESVDSRDFSLRELGRLAYIGLLEVDGCGQSGLEGWHLVAVL